MAEAPLVQQLRKLELQLEVQNAIKGVNIFNGETKRFKRWIKDVEKYGMLVHANDEGLIRAAFQGAGGHVSDHIQRWMSLQPQGTWGQLKHDLRSRYGETADDGQARAVLRKCKQQPQETVIMYSERIRDLSADAYPGQDIDQPLIAGELIQIFIDGLKSSGIARRIIREGPATFDRAVTCATQEQRMIDRFMLRNRVEEPMEVDRVTVEGKTTIVCFRCGEQGHMARECNRTGGLNRSQGYGGRPTGRQTRRSERACWTCGELDHIARNCPGRRENLSPPVLTGSEGQDGSGGEGVPESRAKPSLKVGINKSTFRALVDTGADVSLLSVRAFRMVQGDQRSQHLNRSAVTLKGASGAGIKVLGNISLPIRMGTKTYTHKLHVVEDITSMVILGWDFLSDNDASIECSKQNGTFKIGGQKLLLQDNEYINSLVRLRNNTYVPPRSTTMCKAKFQGQNKGNVDGGYMVLQVDNGFLSREPGLMVMNGLVKVKGRRWFPIAIVNSTNKAFNIKKGNVVAKVGRIEEATVCSLTEACADQEAQGVKTDLSVPEIHKDRVQRLIRENSDLFADKDTELGRTDIIGMRVDTGDHPPIRLKPYKTPFALRGIVDKQINDMLDAGVIWPSHSPWSFPVVLAKKKDGSKRFCVDFRRLNSITTKHNWPMPTIDDFLPTLGKSKYFSTCDLRSGYWQVKMAPGDKQKTAFICHKGLFEFNVMPFGLSCAPGIFCELMSVVLEGLESFASAYMDDVLIFSETIEDHVKHISMVFDRLRKAGLRLKRSKCDFFKKELNYLGHVISEQGIRPNPDKVAAIKDLDAPQTVREVRSFVGMASFYRRYIPEFSDLVEPLTKLTKKHARFEWSGLCRSSFDVLKQKLCSPPILAFPDPTKPYILYTDASDTCIGALLSQETADGERPIQYLSHQLSKSQQNWPVIEKEAYAIVFALQKLRQYLYGAKFTIKCDHKPLKFLFNSEIKNAKVQRWGLMMSEYDCTIEYIAGKANTQADMLSRIPGREADIHTAPKGQVPSKSLSEHSCMEGQDRATVHPRRVGVINSDRIDPRALSRAESESKGQAGSESQAGDTQLPEHNIPNIPEEQSRDPEVVDLVRRLEAGKATITESRTFIVLEGILYYVPDREQDPTLKLVIPAQLHNLVLKECHDNCAHMGLDKTYDRIRDRYHWRGLYKDVAKYVSKCIRCKTRNLKRELRPLQEMEEGRFPFEKIGIDMCGPYPTSKAGNKYLLTVTCLYTGWPEIFAVPDKSAVTVATVILEEIVPRHSLSIGHIV